MLQNLVAKFLFLISVILSVSTYTLVTTLVLVELISMKFLIWELWNFPAPNTVLDENIGEATDDAHAHYKSCSYSEYVKLITFPRQQWLQKRASMLRLYLHCLSCMFIVLCGKKFQWIEQFSIRFTLIFASTINPFKIVKPIVVA